MRIDDRTLNAPPGPQSTPASETHEPGRSGASGTRISESSGGDRTEISSLAGGVSEALGLQAVDRAQHVANLAKAYGAGRYRVDSLNTSRAIVRETLGSHDGTR